MSNLTLTGITSTSNSYVLGQQGVIQKKNRLMERQGKENHFFQTLLVIIVYNSHICKPISPMLHTLEGHNFPLS